MSDLLPNVWFGTAPPMEVWESAIPPDPTPDEDDDAPASQGVINLLGYNPDTHIEEPTND